MDSTAPFVMRNKETMREVVADAEKGVFPGWDEGNGGKPPQPLVNGHGIPSTHKLAQAQSIIQVHVLPNSTWLFPHFDCYVQASVVSIGFSIYHL
jgi:hypothetical protein